jgi:hypothetical protein
MQDLVVIHAISWVVVPKMLKIETAYRMLMTRIETAYRMLMTRIETAYRMLMTRIETAYREKA